MKLADALGLYLKRQGYDVAFGVSGGASLHIIHGMVNNGITFIPTAHEQGASFAADAAARLTGRGVAVATSGPGATNLITGIATSYYDSVPTLYITGNVATFREGKNLGVRQYGFQEFDICGAVDGICNYTNQIRSALDMIPSLDYAFALMNLRRKGPALLDIPDDIQRAEIDYA